MKLLPLLGSGVLKGLGGVGFKPSSLTGNSKRDTEPDACAENVAEKGQQPKVQGNGHVVYGADGYYIQAAVCYIQRWLKRKDGLQVM